MAFCNCKGAWRKFEGGRTHHCTLLFTNFLHHSHDLDTSDVLIVRLPEALVVKSEPATQALESPLRLIWHPFHYAELALQLPSRPLACPLVNLLSFTCDH